MDGLRADAAHALVVGAAPGNPARTDVRRYTLDFLGMISEQEEREMERERRKAERTWVSHGGQPAGLLTSYSRRSNWKPR